MGGVLACELTGRGHTVFAYGRRHTKALRHTIPGYTQWDLSAGPINVPPVDAVVHCAAKVGDWGPEADYQRVNVGGTGVVLQTFCDVDRFIHVSSASVYSGDQSGQHLTETSSVGNSLYTAYARTKVEAEKLVLSSGRSAVILRPQAVYGPGDTTLLPRILAARRFGWLAVPGNGRNCISVTHVLNFVHAVECVLKSPVMRCILNVADADPVSVDELLSTLLQRYKARTRLFYIPRPIAWAAATISEGIWHLAKQPRAPGLTRYLVAHIADQRTLDLAIAYKLIGYSPCHTFRENPIRKEDMQ
jgi:nucleoside-diphosphate-sugar epimerase